MKYFMVIFFLIIFGCTGCSAPHEHTTASAEATTVAYVNDAPIDEREFQLFLNDAKAQTADYFKKTYNADVSPSFWTTSFQGEVPIENAKQLALARMKEIKVQQMLAQQYGLVNDFSYSTFRDNWLKENARREQAIKKNQVIYGPKQYDERGYYTYIFSNLILKVKAVFKEKSTPKGGDSASGGLTEDQQQRALDASYEEQVKQLVETAQVRIVDHVFQQMKVQ